MFVFIIFARKRATCWYWHDTMGKNYRMHIFFKDACMVANEKTTILIEIGFSVSAKSSPELG